MCTAVELPVDFDTVADDSAPAVLADWRYRMDRTLERVEDVPGARCHDLE
jgi:hypothetical protein